MVFFTEKPSRPLAACCRVEVMKGALGLERVGLSSRAVMARLALRRPAMRSRVSASEVGRKAWPSWRASSKRTGSPASDTRSAWTSQYSSGTKARISRSRSTIRRTATDCTRPAERPRAILAHSSGESMKPTTRSRKRRACWASTRGMLRLPGSSKASWMAPLVM